MESVWTIVSLLNVLKENNAKREAVLMLFQLAKKILIALSNGNFAYKMFVKTDAPQ